MRRFLLPPGSAKIPVHSTTVFRSTPLETHGPLGVIWVGIGLICFYIALIWLNSLLGVFLTPLFLIPATWLQDKMGHRKREADQK